MIRRSVDLLPVTRFTTSGVSSDESIRTTAKRTAQLAAYEAAIYDNAALDRLTANLVEANDGDLVGK